MNTQNELAENLTTDQKKACALRQYHDEDYFLTQEESGEIRIFEGTEEDKKSEYESTYLQYCLTGEGNDEEPDSFEDWCNENLTEIDPYDEDANNDYMCLTDDEADQKWEESLDSCLEECIYPTLPKEMLDYFDDDKWKDDARMDGRAHSISSYDGNENEEEIGGETFYIYRLN